MFSQKKILSFLFTGLCALAESVHSPRNQFQVFNLKHQKRLLAENVVNAVVSRESLGVEYFEVETHVIIDSELEEAIKVSNVNDVLKYLTIFFRGVNHIFNKSINGEDEFPSIRIQVSKLTILDSTQENKIFLPISVDGEQFLDIENVLKKLKKHGKKSKGKYDKYDHTMLLTGRDLYRNKDGLYQADVQGVAYLKGACKKSTDDKFESFSVVEDVGAHFQGVYPAVHELAHNLGVKHDSNKKKECSASKGYIMSPSTEQRTNNMYKFSSCSLAALKEFLLSDQGKCLYKRENKPIFPVDLTGNLPGDIYTMKDMCEYFGRITYNEIAEAEINRSKPWSYLCKQLSCKIVASNGKTYHFEPSFAPGENSQCGDNNEGRCIFGECVTT